MKKLLYPFSLIYSFLSFLNKKMTDSKKLDKPVISVGNLTWGGTGKTPIVIELLNFITSNNLKPVVLTRGYGRKNNTAVLLENGGKGISSLVCGDEPLLIARKNPITQIVVSANRYKALLSLKSKIQPDVYVLDDGFQHWKIQRNLDIVCINAANPFGNGLLIPAGILRENVSALKRADLIIITNSNMVSESQLDKLEKEVKKISENKSLAITYYGDFKYTKIDLVTNIDTDILKKLNIYALSGIGFPEGFKNSIKETGVKIKSFFNLKDHQNYTSKMINEIFNKIEKNAYIVITEKDAVKINEILDDSLKEKVAVLNINVKFKKGKEIWKEKIKKCLQSF